MKERRSLTESYKKSQIASRIIAGGICHDVRLSEPHPIYIERGEGPYIWDIDKNKYIDYGMGNGSLLIGHSNPYVLKAINSVIKNGYHFGEEHLGAITWGEKIIELISSVEKVRFVGTGTEAIILSIRIARAFTNKSKIIRIEGHFHGWSDVVGKGFLSPFDKPVSLGIPQGTLDEIIVTSPNIEKIKTLLDQNDDIAAVILEPSGASWGTVPIEISFNRELRDITKKSGVLLIYDEIITGFRYSKGGYQELVGINPDLTTLGKIATGGTSGGIVGGRKELFKYFEFNGDYQNDRYNRVHHFGTFNANPITSAAGLATLKAIETGSAQEESNRMAMILRKGANNIVKDLDLNCLVYGDSSLFHFFLQGPSAMEVDAEALLKTPNTKILKGISRNIVLEFQSLLRKKGLNLFSYTGGVTSASHSSVDIDTSLSIFAEVLSEMKRNGSLI